MVSASAALTLRKLLVKTLEGAASSTSECFLACTGSPNPGGHVRDRQCGVIHTMLQLMRSGQLRP